MCRLCCSTPQKIGLSTEILNSHHSSEYSKTVNSSQMRAACSTKHPLWWKKHFRLLFVLLWMVLCSAMCMFYFSNCCHKQSKNHLENSWFLRYNEWLWLIIHDYEWIYCNEVNIVFFSRFQFLKNAHKHTWACSKAKKLKSPWSRITADETWMYRANPLIEPLNHSVLIHNS